MKSEDLYDTLGVSPNATADEIKQKFRFLAQAYHPDKFTGDEHQTEAEERFKKINAAYQVLSDPKKRARYDLERSKANLHQRQKTYKQNPETNVPYRSRPESYTRAAATMSQPNGSRTVLLFIGILLTTSALAFLAFWGRGLVAEFEVPAAPTETAVPYNTVTPEPVFPTYTELAPLIIPSAAPTETAVPYNTVTPKPVLPTHTESVPLIIIPPAFTITPDLAPTPFSGSIIIGDSLSGKKWEVSIEKILFANQLENPILGNVDKAIGRFAVVFIQVINRDSAPASYCACFEFKILDGEGHIAEVHLSGAQSAKAIYGLNMEQVGPDETLHTVMVFDISLKSFYYVLVPNDPYDSELRGLILNMP